MLQIVALQRGFVFVGDVEREDEDVVIRNASCIRRWGAKNETGNGGLGKLAREGPGQGTILDPCPDVRAHRLTVVFRMDCEARSWTKNSSR